MPHYVAYLAAVLLLPLLDEGVAQPLPSGRPPDRSGRPEIIFPSSENTAINFCDSVNVTYWSPWTGGVNISANCWPGTGTDTEVAQCTDDKLFCSSCNLQISTLKDLEESLMYV